MGKTEKEILIRDEFIRLGQALKLADLVQTGSDAKIMINSGEVLVNGEVEERRGRKLREGDRVETKEGAFIVRSSHPEGSALQ